MMRSKAERSTTRSLMTGNASARKGSTVMVDPSSKWRMRSSHVVDLRRGPCGMPLMVRPHMPQMPSRQSLSKATGSLPSAISCSLSWSSISRNDWLGEMPSTTYSSKRPGAWGPAWRQILRRNFIALALSRRLLVAPLRRLDAREDQGLLVQLFRLPLALVLPHRDVGEQIVAPQRFAVGRLVLLAEVAAARLLPLQRVDGHQLGELQEVGHPARVFQVLVELIRPTGHLHVAPELLAQRADFGNGFLQPLRVAGHADVVPHHAAQLPVNVPGRPLAVDAEQALDLVLHLFHAGAEGRMVRRQPVGPVVGQEVADGHRQNEVAVGQPLHERAGAEPVGAVVGEVGFADGV